MKKMLLGILALSTFAMSENKVFDFSNSKPISGSIEATSELNKAFGSTAHVSKKNTNVDFNIKLDSKIYDFIKLDAKVASTVDIKTEVPSAEFKLENGNFVKVGLDFKKFGTPSVKFESNKGNLETAFAYDDIRKMGPVTLESNTTIKIKEETPIGVKVGLKYDVAEGINLFASGVVGLSFKDEEGLKDVKVSGGSTLGVKLDKYNLDNTLELKFGTEGEYTSLNLRPARYYAAYKKYDFALVNKFAYKVDENILKVKGLSIKPKLDFYVDFAIANENVETFFKKGHLMLTDINVRPAFETSYELVKGLKLETEAAVSINSLKSNTSKSTTFVTTTPSVKAGLNYSF